jgi:hypothetical protein
MKASFTYLQVSLLYIQLQLDDFMKIVSIDALISAIESHDINDVRILESFQN